MTLGPSGPVLELDDVRHAFAGRPALRGVSLEARTGEIYALLGPNGAGKTTLVRAICGRIRPDGGRVRVEGRDPFADGAARARIGLAPQALALYPQLTVTENLDAFARLAGLKRKPAREAVARAMALTGVEGRAASLVRQLSGGFQRRANVAAAILARPSLLVLDEPTAGVDPPARASLGEVLRRLAGEGAAVLLVTHDLDEAEGLADRVGFLRAGEKVAEGEPAALLADAFGERSEVEVDLVETAPDGPCARQAALLAAEGFACAPTGEWTRLADDGFALAQTIAEKLEAAGPPAREVRVRRPTLARLFARLAQEESAP